jgi:thioredoxin reductase
MADFAERYKLQITYKTRVQEIAKRALGGYSLTCTSETGEEVFYLCTNLIIATGLSKPILPKVHTEVKRPIRHYGEFERDHFLNPTSLAAYENKSVLLIGNGNAAYELGNLLTPIASTVTIHGRKPKPWALSTHYTGDLRSTYLPFYDTFLLKSLNAINHDHSIDLFITQAAEEKYKVTFECERGCPELHSFFGDSIDGFDHVIFCTGWQFDDSIFKFPLNLTPDRKYPHVTTRYQSSNNDNLYFIGSLMHSLDFKKSSGGFIHGFRYLIRHFFSINFSGKFEIAYLDKKELVTYMLHKMNKSSALYQMYGQLCDIFFLKDSTYTYYNDVTTSFRPAADFFMLTLEYGTNLITDIKALGKKISRVGKESESPLLHPVLRVFKKRELVDEIHFDEDILANFSSKSRYEEKLERTLRMFF